MVRVLSAAVLIALLVVTVWVLPEWASVALASLIALLGAIELAQLSRHLGVAVPAGFLGPAAAILCAVVALGAFGPFVVAPDALLAVLLALIIAGGALTLAAGPPGPSTLARAATFLMGPIYVGLPLGVVAWIRLVHGPVVVSLLAVLVIVSDSAQYFTGRMFGRRQLAPAVSPAKTMEGAIGGLVAASLVGAVLGTRWIPGASFASGALLGLVVAALGMVGDLFESLIKRSAGVKDSSHLIPGHGGVLDRIDSWLFAAPAYYVFLRYLA